MNIWSEIEVEALVRYVVYFMENSLKRLGVSGKIAIDEVEGGVSPIFLTFQVQRST